MSGIVILGTQWGDEGKGKATDLLSGQVDMVVKFNGGNNAGHTVVIDDEKYALHLLPSGILSPSVVPVIANGVVLNVATLFEEIDQLESRGIDCSKLKISSKANLILPYHQQLDRALENDPVKQKIGTTGRGIGPAYSDKISRMGIRVGDLFDEKILATKISAALESKNRIFSRYGLPEMNADEIIKELKPYLGRLKPMVTDTSYLVNKYLNENRNVLFEGGQATMLDVDFGTYPFVTSSNCTVGGALTGTGLGPTKINRVVGISKAYTTRVGEGPFPTELFDDTGELLRTKGGEFGVTTKRPRRCGWFDGNVAKYSSLVNGLTDIVLTKLDVLTGFKEIPVCVGYKVKGKTFDYVPDDMNDFEIAEPIYEVLPGWEEEIGEARYFEQLPLNTQKYVHFLENLSRVKISIIGVGPKRDQIIVRDSLI